jgi:4-alpha-glucanotransferase
MIDTHLPGFIRFGREVCGDLAQAERREWWLANGLGGYAAGTLAGTLTRRYHDLLVAPLDPPLGRVLVAAKADATLHLDGAAHPLFSNRWAGGHVDPQGHLHIESFRLEGRMPVWRYALGDCVIEQRIWMEPGRNTTYVAFRRDGGAERARLAVRLLVNARDHHTQTRAGEFEPELRAEGARMSVRHPGR